MPQALDSSYTGIGNINNIPAEQRIYGRTKEILGITRGRMPNWRVMSQKMKKGVAVKDMEFKYKSDYPLQAQITLVEASSAVDGGTENRFLFSTSESARLKEGDRIYSDRIFVNNSGSYVGTLASDGSYTPSAAQYSQRECVKLLAKLSVSGSNTYWKVQRNWQPSYATGSTNVEAPINSKWLIGTAPQAIGDNTGGVWGDTPHEETNYSEITLMKMGVARTANKVDIYQGKTLLQRNTERQTELFWKRRENSCLFGRQSLETSSEDGSPIYATGGIDEYISTAQSGIGYVPFTASDTNQEANIINFASAHGAVNYQNLNEFGKNKFYWGSTEKWWICDDIQFTKISNSFDNKVRINYNGGLSQKYGFKISDLEISGGGVFHLAVSDLFSIYGIKNTGYIIDYDYIFPVPYVDEDLTVLIDVEKGMNPYKRIDHMYINSGYVRNCPFAHYKVYNL